MEMRTIVRKIAKLSLTKKEYLKLKIDTHFSGKDENAVFDFHIRYYLKSKVLHEFEKALAYAETTHPHLHLKPLFENLLNAGNWDEIFRLIDACNLYKFSLSKDILQMLNERLSKYGKDEFGTEQRFKPSEITAAIISNSDKKDKLKKYEEALKSSEYYSAYSYLVYASEDTKDRIKRIITDFISNLESNPKFKKDSLLFFFILILGVGYDIKIPNNIVEYAKLESNRFNHADPSNFSDDLIIAYYENDKDRIKIILEKTIINKKIPK